MHSPRLHVLLVLALHADPPHGAGLTVLLPAAPGEVADRLHDGKGSPSWRVCPAFVAVMGAANARTSACRGNKFAAYFDELDADTGALRLAPGSHHTTILFGCFLPSPSPGSPSGEAQRLLDQHAPIAHRNPITRRVAPSLTGN